MLCIKPAHLLFFLLLVGSLSAVEAQSSDEAELKRSSERVLSYLAQKKPDWKHESVTPLPPAHLITIYDWTGSRTLVDKQTREEWHVPLRVRVIIVLYPTIEEAHATIRNFISSRGREPYKPVPFAVGDEGYMGGFARAEITFRRGRYLLYVIMTDSGCFAEDGNHGMATTVAEEIARYVAEAMSAN